VFDLVQNRFGYQLGTTQGRFRPSAVDSGQQPNRLARPQIQRPSLTVVNADIVLVMRRSGVRFPEAARAFDLVIAYFTALGSSVTVAS
jgi:hypothetical protein